MNQPAPAFTPAALVATWAQLITPAPARLWIGYSGGLDSHVLLHAAAAMRDQLPAPLAAVHVQHDLQTAAPQWAAHCQQVCDQLAIPLRICPVHVSQRRGDSVEAAARVVRYAAWQALLQSDEHLVTAHHADDQAETLLLALLRGSGVHGLAAMPVQRPLGHGWLIRPLLPWSRAALRTYAQQHQLQWIDDPSNAHLRYDRNFLRQRVMPLLAERWPSAVHTLTRSAGHCATAAAQLDQQADQLLAQVSGSRPHTLAVSKLRSLPAAERHTVLRRWLAHNVRPLPSQIHLQRVATELMTTRADAQPLVGWDGCEVRRYRDDVFALPPLPPLPSSPLAWPDPRQPLALGDGLGYLLPAPALAMHAPVWVEYGAVPRWRCQSATNRPAHSLKQVLQTAGIPAWLRPYIPLVCDQCGLLALAGVTNCRPECPPIHWDGQPWARYGFFH